jgi:hypothetical protein
MTKNNNTPDPGSIRKAQDRLSEKYAMTDAKVDTAIANKAKIKRDGDLEDAARIMAEHGDARGVIADSSAWQSFIQHVNNAETWDRYYRMINTVATEKRNEATVLSGINERRTYAPESPHSWFVDQATVAGGRTYSNDVRFDQAKARLDQHGVECGYELRHHTAEGRHVRSQIMETNRYDDTIERSQNGPRSGRPIADEAVTRAVGMDNTSASGLSFVTPFYITDPDLVALYRAPVPAFVTEGRQMDCPPYGLTVNLPTWTSATAVGEQMTENTGLTQSSPTTAYLDGGVPLNTYAAVLPVSQQLFDRSGGPGTGTNFDVYAYASLMDAIDASFDVFALTSCIAAGGTYTQGTTLTIPLLYSSISKAREQMANAAGTRLVPSHIFGTSNTLEWMYLQYDGSNRPIFIPEPSIIFESKPSGAPYLDGDSTFSGVFLGNAGFWVDDNTPAYTGQPTYAQIVVARMSEVLVWRSAPVLRPIIGNTATSHLGVDLVLHQYNAVAARFPLAVQTVSGAGLASLN